MLASVALIMMVLPTGQAMVPQDSLLVDVVVEEIIEDAMDYRPGVLPQRILLMNPSVEETVGVRRRAGVEVVRAQGLREPGSPTDCEGVRCLDARGVVTIESFSISKSPGRATVLVEYSVPMRRGLVHCPRMVEWTLIEDEKGWFVATARNLREC